MQFFKLIFIHEQSTSSPLIPFEISVWFKSHIQEMACTWGLKRCSTPCANTKLCRACCTASALYLYVHFLQAICGLHGMTCHPWYVVRCLQKYSGILFPNKHKNNWSEIQNFAVYSGFKKLCSKTLMSPPFKPSVKLWFGTECCWLFSWETKLSFVPYM